MLDLQTIGIGVDTTGLEKGTRALGDTERAANKTADAADKLSDGFTEASKASTLMATAVKVLGSAFAALKIYELAKESAMLAARFETMGVVMRIAGNNAGYTMAQMEGLSKSLQKSGISMLESRNALTQLATANIDLANASKLARAAQDVAVVGNINSSEALARMIHGIKSGEIEILRTMGLNVNFEASYKAMAAQLGITTEALSTEQKALARTNAALQEAARYNGIYEESMTTAGKAMGSLTRYWEDFKVKAGDAFLPALATAVFTLTDALKLMNSEMDAAGNNGTIASVGNALNGGLKTAFETAAVLGANVAFVVRMVIGEIATLATQAVAVGNLDFKSASGIGKEWVAESNAARAGLDAYEKRILGIGQTSKAVAKTTEADRIASAQASRATAETAAKELKTVNDLRDVRQRLSGVNKQYLEDLSKLEAARNSGALAEKEYIGLVETLAKKTYEGSAAGKDAHTTAKAGEAATKAAITQYHALIERATERVKVANDELLAGRELTAAEKQAIKVTELLDGAKGKLSATQRTAVLSVMAEAAAREGLVAQQRVNLQADNDLIDAEYKRVEAAEKNLSSMLATNQSLTEEIGLIGANAKAQKAITIARQQSVITIKEEQLARLQNAEFMSREQISLEEEIRLLKERMTLTGQKFDRTEEFAKLEELRSEGKKFTDDLGRGLTDSLFRAFESGKGFFKTLWDGIKNLFKTTTLKLAINGAVSGVGGALGFGGAGGAATGGSGLSGMLGMANNASSMYSAATGGTGGFINTVMAGYNGTLVGAAGGGSFASTVGAGLATDAMGATVIEGAAAAGIETGIAGGVSAGLAAIPVWGWAALAGVAILGMSGSGGGPKTESGGGFGSGREQNNLGGPTSDYAKGIESSYAGLAKQLGLSSSLSVGAFSSQDKEGDSLTQLLVTADVNGQSVYNRADRTGGVENVGRSDAELQAAMAEEATRVMISALKASDLEQDYKDFLNTVSESATASVLEAAVNRIIAVKGFKDAVESLPFENLKKLSFAAADGLIAAAGGLEKLGASLDTYFQNFYSAGEQRNQVVKNLFKSLGAAGVDTSTLYNPTIAGFRALVEAQDVTTASGQKAYAALLSVSGVFAQLTTSGTAATKVLEETLNASVSGLRELSDALKSTTSALRGGPSLVEARETISAALAKAKSGGGLPTLQALAPSLQAVTGADTGGFSTMLDYQRFKDQTASDTGALGGLVDGQISIEQKMLDALLGIEQSVLTVAEAMGLVQAERDATAALAARSAAEGLAEAQAKAAIDAARATAAAEAAARAAAEAAARAAAYVPPPVYVPIDHGGGGDGGSFAVGINSVPYDMTARIHKDERIMPAADNRELFKRLDSPQASNAELVAAFNSLRSDFAAVVIATEATSLNSRKMADTLVRVTRDGDSMLTQAVV